MTSEQFCYWLQGFLEVGAPKTVNAEQLAVIKEHLQTVFTKETKLTITGTGGSTDSHPWAGAAGSGRGLQGIAGGIVGRGHDHGAVIC